MKLLSTLLFATLFTINAQAGGYTSCNNGSIETVGDNYIQVDFLEKTIEIMPYEASFSLSLKDVLANFNGEYITLAIANKKVEVSAEGETSTATYNIMMTSTDKFKNLNIAYSKDAGPFRSVELTCKVVK